MTRFSIFALVLVFGFFITPSLSFAYKTYDQKAFQITENAAIYTISYRFGIPNRDFYLPIAAVRDIGTTTPGELIVGYEFLEDGKTYTDKGTSAGIVFSNAKVVNGSYFVPAGKSAQFTLLVILSTDPEDAEMDYALHVNSLPFNGIFEDQVLHQKLNATELQYYITPEIELNESNGN